MSRLHRFITGKDLSWWKFNIAVFGLTPDAKQQTQKDELQKVWLPIPCISMILVAARAGSMAAHCTSTCFALYIADLPRWPHAAGNRDSGGPEGSG